MKLQLALEYMIVFSFVLVVFIFAFSLIANQRAVTLSGETFSQLQVVAQQVAMQLNIAQQAGSGFTSHVSLATSPTLLKYNISVTKSGIVIAKAKVGTQIIQAIAYSAVTNIASAASYLSGTTYLLPIANGTIYMQNTFGSICVDLLCPTTSNVPTSIALTAQSTQAALFDGHSTSIVVSEQSQYAIPGSITETAWVDFKAIAASQNIGIVTPGGGATFPLLFLQSGPECFAFATYNSIGGELSTGCAITPRANTWYFVAGSYNLTTGVESVYVNGRLGASITGNALSLQSYGNGFTFGALPSQATHLNGSIANVQIYNASLPQPLINRLYHEGITGAPLQPGNLVGWWPLNGNAYDYAMGNNGFTLNGPIYFPSVAQITAHVKNAVGQPISGALVGFATSLGVFGTGQSVANTTNPNGTAVAFLSEQGQNGQALVRATAFNGNTSTQSELQGWWPLNFGEGNVTHDLSANGNNGYFIGLPSWASPNYAMQFDGRSSYITVPNNAILDPTTFTVNIWVNPALYGNAGDGATTPIPGTLGCPACSSIILSHGLSPTGGYNNQWWFEFRDNNVLDWFVRTASGTPAVIASDAFPQLNRWYMVTGTYSASTNVMSIYIDGVLVDEATVSGAIQTDTYGLLFGGIDASASYGGYFKGKMANMQYYNVALTSPQIMQLYQEGISGAPFGSSWPVAWYPLDGNANDYSGYAGITLDGAVLGNTHPVPILQNATDNQTSLLAAHFNGASSQVVLPLKGNTSTLTITMWANPASVAKMVSGNGYTLFNSQGSNNVQAFLNNGGALGAQPGQGDEEGSLSTANYHGYGVNATWSFLGLVFNSGKLSFYFNASPPFNATIAAGPYSINQLAIAQTSQAISYFNGNMADVQIYNSSLTAAQMTQLYYGGMTAPPIPNAKILGWYPLDGNANDYSGNGNNGAAANVAYVAVNIVNPVLINSLNGYGVTSDDYSDSSATGISIPSTPSITPGSAWTLSFWFYRNAQSPTCDSLIGKSSCGTGFCIYASTSNGCSAGSTGGEPLVFRYTDTGSVVHDALSTVMNIPSATWTFAALTWNSGTATWYINGAKTAQYTGLNAIESLPDSFLIGSGDHTFNGTIADVQFYNNALSPTQVAQLAAALTPPQATASVSLGASP